MPRTELTADTIWTLGVAPLPADLQSAWEWCVANVDGRNFSLTIQHGSLTGNWLLAGRVPGCYEVIFDGGSPLSTTISSEQPNAPVIFGTDDVAVTFRNSTIRAVSGFGVSVDDGCIKVRDVWWGRCGLGCLDANGSRSKIIAQGTQTYLFENQQAAAIAEDNAVIEMPCDVVISGAPAFALAFVHSDLGAGIDVTGMTVSNYGAATGKRASTDGGWIQNPGVVLPGSYD